MNATDPMTPPLGFDSAEILPRPRPRGPVRPARFRVTRMDEGWTPYQAEMPCLDHPEAVAAYWFNAVASAPDFEPDQEQLAVILLNTRRRVIGHTIPTRGVLDSVLLHAREVFRPAIVSAAHAVIIAHNHPSNDPNPSEADIRLTRDLIRAGQILHLELLDSVIVGRVAHRPGVGRSNFSSLRELGYFHTA